MLRSLFYQHGTAAGIALRWAAWHGQNHDGHGISPMAVTQTTATGAYTPVAVGAVPNPRARVISSESTKDTKDTKVGKTHMKALFVRFVRLKWIAQSGFLTGAIAEERA
jgi:hypothetical protein